MNKIYCELISKKLLYKYQNYPKSKKRFFKQNYLYPLLRRIGNNDFWLFHNNLKETSNKYLVLCNSILKDKRKLKLLEKKGMYSGRKTSKYFL